MKFTGECNVLSENDRMDDGNEFSSTTATFLS